MEAYLVALAKLVRLTGLSFSLLTVKQSLLKIFAFSEERWSLSKVAITNDVAYQPASWHIR